MKIGSIELGTGAALAPMAGVTDVSLRRLAARHGAVFTVSEMVSAKALTMGDKKSRQLMQGGGGDKPYGVQLFGYEADTMGQAVRLIGNESYDFLDINMGCPAPKIVSSGSGSALLKDPSLAGAIAKAAVEASVRPVTVKLRIGWDDGCMTGLEVAKRCEAAGVSLLAVHGRTREQQYRPGVNYGAVAAIKAAVSIPVLYNGDVTDGASAKHALVQTGCDGVMVGRAAMGAPWVFADIRAALMGETPPPPPTLRGRFAMLKEQVDALCAERGEDAGMRTARGVAAAYMRGLKGANALRRQAFGLSRYNDLDRLVEVAWEYQVSAGVVEE